MKKFFLILIITFSFQGLVKAETWSCSYKWKDEIRTTVEERKGNNFFTVIEDGKKYKHDKMIELKDRIILIDSIETAFMKVLWKETKTFTMVGLNSDPNENTAIVNGTCRVIR